MDAAFSWADEPARERVSASLLPDGSFAVWPENMETIRLFWSVRRCWRHRTMGGVMGFDWTQVHSKMQLLGMNRRRMQRETLRLEMMEASVMEAIA